MINEKKYELLVNGANFLFYLEDVGETKCGFYTNVYLESPNPHEAELAGVELLKHDNDIREMTLNAEEDSPVMHVEEIYELNDWPEGVCLPRTGLSLYTEEDE